MIYLYSRGSDWSQGPGPLSTGPGPWAFVHWSWVLGTCPLVPGFGPLSTRADFHPRWGPSGPCGACSGQFRPKRGPMLGAKSAPKGSHGSPWGSWGQWNSQTWQNRPWVPHAGKQDDGSLHNPPQITACQNAKINAEILSVKREGLSTALKGLVDHTLDILVADTQR